MFDDLVTYHVHKRGPLPASEALAYQYILAGNGVFIRAETSFFDVLLHIAPCTVRSLAPLHHHFQLKAPRIPSCLLNTILTNALHARRADGGLNEVLYQFHHYGQTVQVKKPLQQATAVSIVAIGGDDAASDDASIICDLHSPWQYECLFQPDRRCR